MASRSSADRPPFALTLVRPFQPIVQPPFAFTSATGPAVSFVHAGQGSGCGAPRLLVCSNATVPPTDAVPVQSHETVIGETCSRYKDTAPIKSVKSMPPPQRPPPSSVTALELVLHSELVSQTVSHVASAHFRP